MAVQVGCRGTWLACEMRAGVLHAKYMQNSVRRRLAHLKCSAGAALVDDVSTAANRHPS